jgi:hypothetical protein
MKILRILGRSLMAAYLIWVWLVISIGSAQAADASLSWTPPTKNTDGTDLTDLAGFKVYYGPSSGNYPQVITIDDPMAVGWIVTGLTDGTWYFVVTAFDDGLNEDGSPGPVNESAYSNEAIKGVAPPADTTPPAAPTDLTVASLTVFTIAKRTDGFILVAVGTVLADTVCDPEQNINGHYVVPRANVTWAPTVGEPKPLVVVANCS